MKVLLISHVYAFSSRTVTKKLRDLSKVVELTVVSPDRAVNTLGYDKISHEQTDSYRTIRCTYLGSVRGGTKYLLRSLTLGLRSLQPDIIQVDAEPWSLVLFQVILARYFLARRSKLLLFSWENVERKGLKGLLLSGIYRFIGKAVDFVIAGNEGAKQMFLKRGLPVRRVEVLTQFGIDAEAFFEFSTNDKSKIRSELGITPDDFVVGYAGRFVEEKGILELLGAVDKLSAIFPKMKVLFLGAGPLGSHINSVAERQGRIIVVPPVSQDAVPRYLNAMDVLYLGSKTTPTWSEQFGRVLVEAMACGIVPVASGTGEIPKVIDDPDLIFQPGDKDSIIRIISKLAENKSMYETKKSKLKRRAVEVFESEVIARRTIDIYRKVLDLGDRKACRFPE